MAVTPPTVGTAGWAIASREADAFGDGGSVLHRYATRLTGVEVNSCFYRPHRRATWERWRDAVPAGFRFAAKIPRVISHERRLVDCQEPLARFLGEVAGLGDKLGVLLLQLPPSLAFDPAVATVFLRHLTGATPTPIACEPRHPSWFRAGAEALLCDHRVARVAADPAVVPAAAAPGGWPGLAYYRQHGSPVRYRSRYGDARISALARALDGPAHDRWCIFDNTAAGAATGDALRLMAAIASSEG